MLIVYAPFCSPASPPYSLAHLKASVECDVLDLNLLYYKKKFNDLDDFLLNSASVYSLENKKVINGGVPDYFDEFLELCLGYDKVAFSVVYSSQVFYTLVLLKELVARGVECVVGGPAVNSNLLKYAKYFSTVEEFVGGDENVLDFSCFDGYLTSVIPLKTVSACCYQGCTFCTHYEGKYKELSLDLVRETLVNSKAKKVFLIDDMNHCKRLLELSKVFKDLGVEWMCQLRPDSNWSLEVLQELYDSGLRVVLWGVESGCDRVLKLMNKGTSVVCVEKVLKDSSSVGINNVVYMMFGFPGEVEEELLMSVEFLERNSEFIDLVSPSTFGLQKGSEVYSNPSKFGVFDIKEKKRTVLDPTISYSCSGLSQEEAERMKKKYLKRINKVNKYPKWMNLLREYMLV